MTEGEIGGWHHQLNGHDWLTQPWQLVIDKEAWRAAVQNGKELDTTE